MLITSKDGCCRLTVIASLLSICIQRHLYLLLLLYAASFATPLIRRVVDASSSSRATV
jgi:hypothetical protein